MAESIPLIDPNKLRRNPENPRLIFRQDELDTLLDSIAEQGILVPLTVFQDRNRYIILDGERRWRCSIKLGLSSVPAIVQPKPTKLQNIMMMFAIHNARTDWDPLPTALKLQELENEFEKINGRKPKEVELAGLASISRGEVRRLKQLLRLPQEYMDLLLEELEKPRPKQEISVDHILEITRGARALKKRDVISDNEEEDLRKSLISKYRTKVEQNTVAPRKLSRIGQAIDRGEVSLDVAGAVTRKLIYDPEYTIEKAFQQSVEQVDFEHNLDQLVTRLINRLDEYSSREYVPSKKLSQLLERLSKRISHFVRD